MNKLIKTQNSKSNSLVRLILHIYQSCCKLYLNYDVQTQIHYYFNGSFFCSVVASVLRTFTRFFSVNVLARVDFLV